MFSFVWNFALPILIFVFCYGRIFHTIRRQSKIISGHTGRNQGVAMATTSRDQNARQIQQQATRTTSNCPPPPSPSHPSPLPPYHHHCHTQRFSSRRLELQLAPSCLARSWMFWRRWLPSSSALSFSGPRALLPIRIL